MLYPAELRARRVSSLGSVVGSVKRLSEESFDLASRVSCILTITVPISSFTSIVFIKYGTILLSGTALTVLSVFFFVVALHETNIVMLGRRDLNPRLPVYKTDALTN
jgi:hypothetical protein